MQNIPCTHFREKERLRFFDCDYLGRMKLSAILKWSSEIAGRDYTVKGFGHEILWKQDMVFLLSRVTCAVKRYPREQENLTVTTWEAGNRGAMFMRKTEIEDDSGEVIISLESGWVLANPVTRHIYKPSHYEFNMPQDKERETFAPKVEKIKYDELELIGTRQVRLSDLDENEHVYNATYADMASDALGKEVFTKDIEIFRINYVSEALYGEEIKLMKHETEDGLVVVGKVNDSVCFECKYKFR